jgi:putative SOS response-associated peptidase YedK
MCGRYVLIITGKMLAANYELAEAPEISPRYNIAPSQEAPVIRYNEESGQREFGFLKWGLVPFWADEPKTGYKTINARAETVEKSPAYRAAFKRRRCLVPADGFYEWKKVDKSKEPYLIHRPQWENFAFAGLWERWEGGDGRVIESYSIITTEPNDLIRKIHNRAPVILNRADYGTWIDPETAASTARKLLRPYEGDLEMYRVDKRVNSPSNDDPSCIEEAK